MVGEAWAGPDQLVVGMDADGDGAGVEDGAMDADGGGLEEHEHGTRTIPHYFFCLS
jgi:hypothetical protein